MDRVIRVPGGRTCVLILMTAFMAVAATLVTPADAGASRFRWKADQSGNWNDPAMWINVDDDPDGYPKDPGDGVTIATLGSDTRFITIPENVTVSVGQFVVLTSQTYIIDYRGPTVDKLVFDTGTGENAQIFKIGGARFSLWTRTRLESPLTIDVGQDSSVTINQSLVDSSFGSRSVTKKGVGALTFFGTNLYTGLTKVEAGQLELDGTGQVTVNGNLEIGGPEGAAAATVVVLEPNQIASPRVEVKKTGKLLFRATDQIGQLVVDDGHVISRDGAEPRLASLVMTGGILEALNAGRFEFDGDVTAKSTGQRSAAIKGDANSAINLLGSPRTFRIEQSARTGLIVSLSMIGFGTAGVIKTGPGILEFDGPYPNSYPAGTTVTEGALELSRTNISVGGALSVGAGAVPASIVLKTPNNIADNVSVTVEAKGTLGLANNVFDRFAGLLVRSNGLVVVGNGLESTLMVTTVTMSGGELIVANQSRLKMNALTAATSSVTSAVTGPGVVLLEGNDLTIETAGAYDEVVLRVDSVIGSAGKERVIKRGTGGVQFTRNNTYTGDTVVEEGVLYVTGKQPASPIALAKGTLGGTGTVGAVTAGEATIAPGLGIGRLTSGSVTFAPATTLAMVMNGPDAGAGYDQLAVNGAVNLGNAKLGVLFGFTPAQDASFTIVENDGTDPVVGTFAELPEGHKLSFEDLELTLTYRGGDGNDVVLSAQTEEPETYTYYLAEGATGDFFDDDVLIANPNETEEKAALTFLKEGGSTITVERTIAPLSRITVHVDGIPGLEGVSASVKVESDRPLVVERTMFWDATYYGGHTANAVARPETRWIFAEGSQGDFYDTFVLIANANPDATTATLTFLREGDTPFVATVELGPFARKTVWAGEFPEVVGRAFGVVVESTLPVIAERSMYFASAPGRRWLGGHVNTGTTAPSTSWFHAEGATGDFFTTFILLSNPQDTDARIQVRFLLDDGTVIAKDRTLAARQRVTINPAEEDPRLAQAQMSTVIESDVPIVSERSMYWREDRTGLGEGHNSSGVTATATRWGLAEGRIGGPHEFLTYILLANPSASEADVAITFLRESGQPIVRTYKVPPTSRFNVDVKSVVPELVESTFGALIEVANGVPIAVERSLYWNANGVFLAGGSNALGTPLQGPSVEEAPISR